MQKSKLGISVGLLGALVYFGGLFNGMLLLSLIAGYILIAEENVWVKRTAVKAVIIYVLFALASTVVGFIPDLMGILNNFLGIFGTSFSPRIITSFISFIQSIISFAKTIVFLLFGFKALSQGTIVIPFIDNLVNKHMQ